MSTPILTRRGAPTGRACAAVVVALASLSLACRGTRPSAQTTRPDTTVATLAPSGVTTNVAEVVHEYPHDATTFTEGLEWYDGALYESTGLIGQSGVRRVDLPTGAVTAHVDLPAPHFGEGITVFHGTLYEMTWKEGIGFKYDARSLAARGRFTYAGEGWGLTHDARSLIMSDGTNVLRYLDPATLRVERALTVTAEGMSVPRLNELERIHGEIWANVWQVPQIARIDPTTGHVIGWVDLTPLMSQFSSGDTVDVANGVAYDSATDRIFVTGKLWPTLYQIRLGRRE